MRNKSRPKQAIRHEVTADELSAHAKAAAAAPTRKELERAFGANRIKDEGNGDWSLKLNGAREHALYDEIDGQRANIESDICAASLSKVQHETLVGPGGESVQVAAEHAETVAERRGMRPRINWGRPSRRYVNGQWHDMRGR